MSAVLILTPVIIASWPAITAAVAGAATALGFVVKKSAEEAARTAVGVSAQAEQNVEVELADSEVLADNLATSEELVVSKGGVELRVRRDGRGRCSVCAKGIGHTKAELQTAAEEFVERMTQCFVYSKVMMELQAKGFQVVNEEVLEDETVRIHVRRWEE